MTTKPTFSLAFAPNPRSRPIMDGTVRPEGIELIPTASGPGGDVPPGSSRTRSSTSRRCRSPRSPSSLRRGTGIG